MLSRRVLLAGAASLPRLFSEIGPCDYTRWDTLEAELAGIHPPNPGQTLGFSPDGGTPAERPLWSSIAGTAAETAYFKTLVSAYQQMLAFPQADPRGMPYQAWLHWKYCNGHAAGGDIHSTTAFLGWHRAYIYFYERLIQELTTPTFRLAVWDWETSPTIPRGYANNDKDLLPALGCTYSRGTPKPADAGMTGWLRPYPDTAAQFMGDAAHQGPHDNIHTAVSGIMGALPIAALDPLFFGHHANIDRLFDFWRNLHPDASFWNGLTYPADTWTFYDAKKSSFVNITAGQMLELTGLGYFYKPPNVAAYESNYRSVVPTGPDSDFKELLDQISKLDPLFDFQLPVTIQFSGYEKASAGSHTFYLAPTQGVKVALADFAIWQHSHSAGLKSAFGGVARKNIDPLLALHKGQGQLVCVPAVAGLKVEWVRLQYPKKPHDWTQTVMSRVTAR